MQDLSEVRASLAHAYLGKCYVASSVVQSLEHSHTQPKTASSKQPLCSIAYLIRKEFLVKTVKKTQ